MFLKIKQLFQRFSKSASLSPTVKKRKLLVCGLVVLGLVYCWSYYWQTNPNRQPETEVAKQEGKIKITADTDIVQKTIYLKCRDEEVSRAKPKGNSDNLIGLNYNQTQKIYPGWIIEKFDSDEVEMVIKVNSMCREHANNTFIGIRDGYVAVFYGVPGPRALLKEVTSIPINEVMPEDLKEIREGMKVNSKEELLRTLEGMYGR